MVVVTGLLDVDLDSKSLLIDRASKAFQALDAESQIKARQHSWKGFTNAVEPRKHLLRN
jgi:hypothetical protein